MPPGVRFFPAPPFLEEFHSEANTGPWSWLIVFRFPSWMATFWNLASLGFLNAGRYPGWGLELHRTPSLAKIS